LKNNNTIFYKYIYNPPELNRFTAEQSEAIMSFLKPAVPVRTSLSGTDNRNRLSLNNGQPHQQQQQHLRVGLQSTSTPRHDNNLPPMSMSANSYSSPPQFDASSFDSSNPGSYQKVNPPRINIINNSTIMSSEDRMTSYQHVKRIMSQTEMVKEAELREKEKYLEQLRSIDISKFSFPNE
jgi:hypothetical protein